MEIVRHGIHMERAIRLTAEQPDKRGKEGEDNDEKRAGIRKSGS